MINLPFVHSTWQEHRLDQDGVDDRRHGHRPRRATTATSSSPSRSRQTDDQPGFSGTVRVDEATYDDAVASQQVQVRVLPGLVDGLAGRGRGPRATSALVITVVADVFLLILVLLLVRFGSRLRQEMVLVATEDLERCPPGSVLDQVDGLRFVVCGEVETDRGRRGGARPRRPPGPGGPGRPPQPRRLPAAGPGNWDNAQLRGAANRLPFRIVTDVATSPRVPRWSRRRAGGPGRPGAAGARRGPALRLAHRDRRRRCTSGHRLRHRHRGQPGPVRRPRSSSPRAPTHLRRGPREQPVRASTSTARPVSRGR